MSFPKFYDLNAWSEDGKVVWFVHAGWTEMATGPSPRFVRNKSDAVLLLLTFCPRHVAKEHPCACSRWCNFCTCHQFLSSGRRLRIWFDGLMMDASVLKRLKRSLGYQFVGQSIAQAPSKAFYGDRGDVQGAFQARVTCVGVPSPYVVPFIVAVVVGVSRQHSRKSWTKPCLSQILGCMWFLHESQA